jgi:hypothetical protein
MRLSLRTNLALLCDVCERPLPDDDTKIEIALFGVDRPCPSCKQPIPEEEWEALTKKVTESCQTH